MWSGIQLSSYALPDDVPLVTADASAPTETDSFGPAAERLVRSPLLPLRFVCGKRASIHVL